MLGISWSHNKFINLDKVVPQVYQILGIFVLII
jgi:hypothetical protein